MPVLGIKLKTLKAKRGDEKATSQIKVNSVPKITDVNETSMPMFGKKALSVDFDFVTDYTPNLGTIKMSGEVYFVADNTEELLKSWKDKSELPDAVRVEILNHLFRSCLLKVANMADDLQLPSPMAIPRVKPKEKKE